MVVCNMSLTAVPALLALSAMGPLIAYRAVAVCNSATNDAGVYKAAECDGKNDHGNDCQAIEVHKAPPLAK